MRNLLFIITFSLFSQFCFSQEYLVLKRQETIFLYNPVNKRATPIMEGFFYKLISAEYEEGKIHLYYKNRGILKDTCIQIDSFKVLKFNRISIQLTQEKIKNYSRTTKIYNFGGHKLVEDWDFVLFSNAEGKIWEKLKESIDFGIFPLFYDMYQSPVFSNDGNNILFTHNRNGKHFSIVELNILNTNIKVIMKGALNATYSESNRFILLEKPDLKYYRSKWYIYDRNNQLIWEPLEYDTYTAMWLSVL
jgi:hypothetical protein